MARRRKPLVKYPKFVPAEGGTHYVHADNRDTPANRLINSILHQKKVKRFKELKEAADKKALARLKQQRGAG